MYRHYVFVQLQFQPRNKDSGPWPQTHPLTSTRTHKQTNNKQVQGYLPPMFLEPDSSLQVLEPLKIKPCSYLYPVVSEVDNLILRPSSPLPNSYCNEEETKRGRPGSETYYCTTAPMYRSLRFSLKSIPDITTILLYVVRITIPDSILT